MQGKTCSRRRLCTTDVPRIGRLMQVRPCLTAPQTTLGQAKLGMPVGIHTCTCCHYHSISALSGCMTGRASAWVCPTLAFPYACLPLCTLHASMELMI